MRVFRVDGTFEQWRRLARDLLAQKAPPEEVSFTDGAELDLFAAESAPEDPSFATGLPLHIPASFLATARMVACHRDNARWDRLYRALWRATTTGRGALLDPADSGLVELQRMATAVRKDLERLLALVRFRKVRDDGAEERYVAFHRPLHRTLPLAAPFFARRYASTCWSILTPEGSAHWDRRAIWFGPGVVRGPGVTDDVELLWRAYYATTFNPARVNERALAAHLPKRHWATLPEGRDIAGLVRRALVLPSDWTSR